MREGPVDTVTLSTSQDAPLTSLYRDDVTDSRPKWNVSGTTSPHVDHFDDAFCPGFRDLPPTERPDEDAVCPATGCFASRERVDVDFGSLAAAAAAVVVVVVVGLVVVVVLVTAAVLPVRLGTAALATLVLDCFTPTSRPPLTPPSAL